MRCLRLFSCARVVFVFTLVFLSFLGVDVPVHAQTPSPTPSPSPSPSPTPTPPPPDSCPAPWAGNYWMYAGSWTFHVFGAYESTYHYPPPGTFATPARVERVCYWLLDWSYGPPSAYEYDVFVREGPWRAGGNLFRWTPGGPHTFFRGGEPLPVLIGISWYYPVASGTLVVYYEVPGSPTATPSLSPTPSSSPTPSPSPTPSSSPTPVPAVDCTRWVDVTDEAPAVFRPFRAGVYWLEVASGSLWWSGQYHGPGVYPYVYDGYGVVRVAGTGRVRFCESDPSVAATPTITRTPTRTPTITRTPTPTETPGTRTPTRTRTPTLTRTPRPTRTPSLTRTPTPTLAPSPTWTPLPTSTRDPYQPPSAVPRYTLAPVTPPPSGGDLSWEGSLVDDLMDGLEALRRAVAPPAARICDLPAPVLADAPELHGMRDAFPDFVAGLCAFFGVASPVLGFVRLPVTLMVVGFVFWTAWKVFRSLS